MPTTPYLQLPLLEIYHVDKERLLNEIFYNLDSILSGGIVSMHINEPPINALDGDKYIIPNNIIKRDDNAVKYNDNAGLSVNDTTNAWFDKSGQIAVYSNDVWIFIKPRVGTVAWIDDENALFVFNKAGEWKKLNC